MTQPLTNRSTPLPVPRSPTAASNTGNASRTKKIGIHLDHPRRELHQYIHGLGIQRLAVEARANADGFDPIAADLANELNQPRRIESLAYLRASGEYDGAVSGGSAGERFIPA